MELDHIKNLLEKYFEATTTEKEEIALRNYFNGNNVADHLKGYVPMFQYFSEAKKERFTKKVQYGHNIKAYFKWAAAVAIILISVGLYMGNSNKTTYSLEQDFTAEEIASAQEALNLLAINFNKGTKQITHLEEFGKNTTKFLNKEDKQ